MNELITQFNLTPHPEGGYYREIYRSCDVVNSPRANEPRSAVTQIYFLLEQGQISRFHRVVHDEIWHHYKGDPLELILFDGNSVETRTIGPGQEHFTTVVPAEVFQAARSLGTYSFTGCTVAPGFDFRDFSFLSDAPGALERFKAYSDRYGQLV